MNNLNFISPIEWIVWDLTDSKDWDEYECEYCILSYQNFDELRNVAIKYGYKITWSNWGAGDNGNDFLKPLAASRAQTERIILYVKKVK